MSSQESHHRRDLLVAYFVFTFAFTWGIAALILLSPGLVEALFGKMSASSPVFVVAVAGPTIAATTLTFMRNGWPGLRALYGRLIQWRFGVQWYAAILVGLPLICYIASHVTGARSNVDFNTPSMLFGLLLNNLVLGPLGEELGWRGFALPRLLQRFNPLVASLVLGAIWGVWHLPAFFVSGLPQAGLSIPVFLFGAVCMSIVATWIFHHTGGSVLSVALFHYMVNVSRDVFGTPLSAFTVAIAVVAILVVMLDRQPGWLRHERIQDAQIQGALS